MTSDPTVTRLSCHAIPAPLRTALAVAGCVLLGMVNGFALALVEMAHTALEAVRDCGGCRPRQAVAILLRGLGAALLAVPAPICSNLLVGAGAGLELGRQLDHPTGRHFELTVGGGLNMSFCSYIDDLLTTGEVVKVGYRSRYALIESYRTAPRPESPPVEVAVATVPRLSRLDRVTAPTVAVHRAPAHSPSASVVNGLRTFVGSIN